MCPPEEISDHHSVSSQASRARLVAVIPTLGGTPLVRFVAVIWMRMTLYMASLRESPRVTSQGKNVPNSHNFSLSLSLPHAHSLSPITPRGRRIPWADETPAGTPRSNNTLLYRNATGGFGTPRGSHRDETGGFGTPRGSQRDATGGSCRWGGLATEMSHRLLHSLLPL